MPIAPLILPAIDAGTLRVVDGSPDVLTRDPVDVQRRLERGLDCLTVPWAATKCRFDGVSVTLKPLALSQFWTAAASAAVGANCARNWVGDRKCRYDELLGFDTAAARALGGRHHCANRDRS